MVENKPIYVLDTSAIFCLRDDGSGADKVEKILEEARYGRAQVLVSFMSLMEYLYINLMRAGKELAHRAYLQLTLLPITIVESNEDLRLMAAALKAGYNISLGDAWIAATAVNAEAVLVHRDPEFEALDKEVKQLFLPYKGK